MVTDRGGFRGPPKLWDGFQTAERGRGLKLRFQRVPLSGGRVVENRLVASKSLAEFGGRKLTTNINN